MAQTIKLKRSSVSGNTPGTSDLELGEVAINTYDGKMFIKKNDGSDAIVEIGGSSGTVTEAFKTIAVSGQSNVVADSATDTLTLVAGSNMTLTTNASGDTITFASSGGGGTQNVFTTFAVSGQSSVVADSTTDTLTLAAGSGIGITTTAGTDTITIANTNNLFSTIAVSGQSNVVADATSDTLTLVAGTGITLTTDASADSVTIANSAVGANAFGNIAVSGQSTVAADSTNDTVTFVEGSNMTITTNASGDTVTFASSGGGGSQNVFSNIAVAGQGTIAADATTDTLTIAAGSGISLATSAATDTLTITSTGGSSSVANAASSIKEFKYDIGSNTTTITGSDANSQTLAYEAGAIQVFLNGILLDPATDYTASNGTSVVLTDAAVNGDDVQIVAFNRKIVTANVGIDTFTGNGSTTAYTLSNDPVNENNTRVHIDGVYQEKAAYAVSGTTLTFSGAPPNGSSIEVEIGFTQAEIGSTLDFADNAILRIGTGNDLQILHDGSNSIIKDTGTGDLQIAASTLEVKNSGLNETMIKAIENGAVELYHDNNKKLETVTGGVTITGTVTATTFSGDLSGTINTATTGATQSASDNSTKLATTAYVTTALSNLVDSAPGTLNTLNELAAALGDDANFSTTITNSLATKVGLTATTGAANMPAGTTAQRPGSPAAGQFRYNSTLSQFEGYTSSWGAIGGGGTNTFTTDTLTTSGSATVTLSQAVSSPNDCIVHIDGIYQTPTDAYTVSGTTLTFTATPASGRKVVVYSIKAGVSGNNLNTQTFSGDGSATSFTMNVNPINENNTIVHIDGVYQQKTSYSTSGTTLAFSAAPANGTTIEVATFTQTEINVPVNDTIDTVHIKDDAVTSAKLGGDLVIPGHMSFSDNKEVRIGAGDDLKLYHDSNNSYISDTGTGDLIITGTVLRPRTDQFTLNNAANSENMINAVADGAVTLYYDGSAKLATASGGVTVTGTVTATTLAGTLSTAAQTNITSLGTLTSLTVDDITINGSTISDGGNLTLDAAGEIILDSDSEIVRIYHNGGNIGAFQMTNDDFYIRSMIADKDLVFQGYDSSTNITALTLDMSEAGFATFNSGITLENQLYFNTSGSTGGYLYNDNLDFVIRNFSQDKDLVFKGNDGGSVITALTLDMSAAGAATFGGRINPGEHIIFGTTTGYLQFPGASSRAWAMASQGGTAAPGTSSATFGIHHWSGSAWTNPINITASGKLCIGTDNPDRDLHIKGSGSDVGIQIEKTGVDELRVAVDSTGPYLYTEGTAPFRIYQNNGIRLKIDNSTVLVGGASNTAGGYQFKVGHSNNQGELGIYADSSGADLLSYNRTSAAYNPLKIHAGAVSFTRGNQTVSIGTTVPDFRINQMLGVTSAGARGGMAISSYHNSAAGPIFDFNISRNVSPGSHTIVQTNDALGTIIWRGDDGTQFVDSAAIEVNVDATPGVNDMPGRMVFYTSPDGTTGLQERLRIDNAGHLLPGTDAAYNLGSASKRWDNLFVNDMHFSNEGSDGNDIDGTTGNWTLQEGEEHLYIINNKSGKKFKFSLEEVQ